MTIEIFFKTSSDSAIQEYLKLINTDTFCQIIDEYPQFVKERIFENLTERTKIYFEEKIKKAKLNPMTINEKEEFKKYYEVLLNDKNKKQ